MNCPPPKAGSRLMSRGSTVTAWTSHLGRLPAADPQAVGYSEELAALMGRNRGGNADQPGDREGDQRQENKE